MWNISSAMNVFLSLIWDIYIYIYVRHHCQIYIIVIFFYFNIYIYMFKYYYLVGTRIWVEDLFLFIYLHLKIREIFSHFLKFYSIKLFSKMDLIHFIKCDFAYVCIRKKSRYVYYENRERHVFQGSFRLLCNQDVLHGRVV